MHPLAVWLISTSQFRERENEDRLMRRQRDARVREAERARDQHWADVLHRRAEQAAQARAVEKAPAPRTVAPTMGAAAAGCATA
ncbi:hypothetical protein G3T36_16270 [Diaminobutyricibacter tongyongensis]|uniref:Uncharacterized protein n=1 Tax=Leifsonia tongyongensis TaxID=1268043 RepID=A0A6L9Y1F8_9MICO|nr:hypothetical protein [Diaminobutyricibacter tongyongensis]NEN07416.1 hypothetical protein [Diaminobutyricibacter tongyongensis]